MKRNGNDCVSIRYDRFRYYIKKQIDGIVCELKKLYVARDALQIVNERLGIDVRYRTFTGILVNEGFVAEPTVPFRKDWFFVERSRIEELVKHFFIREQYMKATTAYGKYNVFKSTIKYVNKDIPKTLSFLDSYSLAKSNAFKGRDNTPLSSTFKNIYKYLNEGLHKELDELTSEELEILKSFITIL